MIFSRRAIQRCLDRLRLVLSSEKVDRLVYRLNTPSRDSLAAMWEVVTLESLSQLGEIKHEQPLSTGRKPDVVFIGNQVNFIADITTISDHGLDEISPQKELADQLTEMRKRLGIELQGMNLTIGNKIDRKKSGNKVSLKLPKRKYIRDFVSQKIEPVIKKQLADGDKPLSLIINDGETELELTIDLMSVPYDSSHHAVYDIPTIVDSNPLYNALKGKKNQLRDSQSTTGVIVCDGGSTTLAERISGVSTEEILRKYLRLNSSIDFVLLITVREKRSSPLNFHDVTRSVFAEILSQDTFEKNEELKRVFDEMIKKMPKPILMPVNAALRACEDKYPLGFHGGGRNLGDKHYFSLREMMEILSDSVDPKMARYSSEISTYFKKWLEDGCLPSSISLKENSENSSDTWIEVVVGKPDPAISPFK